MEYDTATEAQAHRTAENLAAGNIAEALSMRILREYGTGGAETVEALEASMLVESPPANAAAGRESYHPGGLVYRDEAIHRARLIVIRYAHQSPRGEAEGAELVQPRLPALMVAWQHAVLLNELMYRHDL